ncbi:MAG: response regulator transcription factor [Sedimentisphaerales bacterium]|jgi:DNA-binding NarL/FixJ family response regulator
MSKIKVMIVDDHTIVREGLKQLVSLEEDIEVVAEARNGLECLQLIESVRPDLIFMDVRMPGINGIEATRLVCQKYPEIKVVMLTIYDDDHYVTEAVQAGAKGYIIKKINRDDLVKVIRHVVEDRAFLDPTVTATLFSVLIKSKTTFKQKGKASLTKRELEVLKEMVAGHTDHDIADSLYISEHTVRSHIKNLYRKLGVSSKSQAVARAIHDNIIHQGD